MSVIEDGMDQSKTKLPNFVNVSKTVSQMYKLRTHITGVLVHGLGAYAFIDLHEFTHGSNMTIEALMTILFIYRDQLPPVLYIQLDNAAGSNKNRFVLGFLSFLVELGVFKKIRVSFLMVGHTHEDVDQYFSCISSWLRKRNILTLSSLCEGIEKCYKHNGSNPTPVPIIVKSMHDYTSWLIPHLEPIFNHSRPHQFRITRGDDGKAEIVSRKWSSDPWVKCAGEASGRLLKSHPEECPRLLTPHFDDLDFFKLKSDVQGCFPFFTKDEDKAWWENWFKDMEKKIEGNYEH